MTDLTTLKAQRSAIKGQLTRFQTFFDKSDKESPDLIQLETRLVKAEPLFDEFNEIQTKLEMLDTETAQEEHENERDVFEKRYFDLITEVKRILAVEQKASIKSHKSGSKSKSSGSESGSENSQKSHETQISRTRNQIRLPKLDLPQFDGNYSNWLFFRDTFNSVIHMNKDISQIQKFHYLRSTLKGEACEVISSLEISSENYDLAWSLLLERYENKPLLIGNHVKALFNLNTIPRESFTELRSILDNVTKHLRALEVLGQPVENWDTLIIHLVSSKLDPSTRREWESKNTNNEAPTFNDLAEFLKQKCRLLEALHTNNPHSQIRVSQDTRHKIKSHVSTGSFTCIFCKENHVIYSCPKFINLNTKERFTEAKQLGLCVNCLRKGHSTQACVSGTCRKCDRKHHTLLHFSNDASSNESENPSQSKKEIQTTNITSNSAANLVSSGVISHTLLSTAVIQIFDKRGNLHDCRALLDSGSERSFITEQLACKLQLVQQNTNFTVSGINQNLTSVNKCCQIKIQSKHNSFKTTVTCLILPKITERLPCFSFNRTSLNIPNNIMLADPKFDESREIDILLGADVFWNLLKVGHIKLGKNKPSLQKTHLGWLISGQIFPNKVNSIVTSHFVTNSQISEQIKQFWELEQVDIPKTLTPEEAACELHFTQNCHRNDEGRFIVSIPFKQDPEEHLGTSKEQAEKRFYNLERKLHQNSTLKEQYVQFLKEYEALGHMTKLNYDEGDGYYMPHHGVSREDKTTTKLRVVFDASASTSTGISLNQLQMVGPVIQDDLLSIILRFRKYAYVVSADISKMYRQVVIEPEQRKYQKILWRNQPNDELSTYQLNTVTYGTTAASFLAVRSLNQLAQEYKSDSSHIAEIIQTDFYVDDLLTGAKLIENTRLWWHGPQWLSEPQDKWPQDVFKSCSIDDISQEVSSEIKKTAIIVNVATYELDFINKFSSFTKLQRVIAYCLRFKTNSAKSKENRAAGPLTTKELEAATSRLVYLVQQVSFSKDISDLNKSGSVSSKSKLLSLNPFLDAKGIIRVGGRFKYADFDVRKRHPVILPTKHHLSILIAEYEHLRLLHAGPETVLSSLRERFWIISGRNLVKRITRHCLPCFRHNSINIKYIMSDLPKERITPARPFINCGLDYCGPFTIRDRLTRNYKPVKAYVCLFVCLVTKAIHLELVSDLTTQAFLAALRRFTSRRGKCINLYSDNGTNFVGANAELWKMITAHKSDFQDALTSDGITWHFIPPKAPHFGGLWEAGVKSVKAHMKRVLGNAVLTFEHFATVLTQIEACLNSRPLHPLSVDPNDLNALTPSHFLIGEKLTSIPDADYSERPETCLSRYQRLQKIMQHFWKRWTCDYLAELQVRNKWKQKHSELLKPGILVLIREDNLPPLKWSIGRVLETHEGNDGVARVVTVKTSQGVYKRPVSKLCILPSESEC